MSEETKQLRVSLDVNLHALAKARMAELRTGWDWYVASLIRCDLEKRDASFLAELAHERGLREQERAE